MPETICGIKLCNLVLRRKGFPVDAVGEVVDYTVRHTIESETIDNFIDVMIGNHIPAVVFVSKYVFNNCTNTMKNVHTLLIPRAVSLGVSTDDLIIQYEDNEPVEDASFEFLRYSRYIQEGFKVATKDDFKFNLDRLEDYYTYYGMLKRLEKETTESVMLCPFCGTQAIIEEQKPHKHFIVNMPDHLGSFSIGCPKCGCGHIRSTREEVLTAWNSRVLDNTSNSNIEVGQTWLVSIDDSAELTKIRVLELDQTVVCLSMLIGYDESDPVYYKLQALDFIKHIQS